MVAVTFYSLPMDYLGFDPSSNATHDLHKQIFVNGVPQTTPFTGDYLVGNTIQLSSPGAVIWDYYGFARQSGETINVTIQDAVHMMIAPYFLTTPPQMNIPMTLGILAVGGVVGAVVVAVVKRK